MLTFEDRCVDLRRSVSDIRSYSEEPDPPASLAFLEAANAYIIEHNLQFPNSVQDAILLYVELVAFLNLTCVSDIHS